MELNLQVLGNPDRCDAVWDQILNVRMQLNDIKIQKEVTSLSRPCDHSPSHTVFPFS